MRRDDIDAAARHMAASLVMSADAGGMARCRYVYSDSYISARVRLRAACALYSAKI